MKKIAILLATIIALCGCEKFSTLRLNTEEVIMYSLEEHYITSDGTNVSFSSENPYVAAVNPTTGKVTGMHIGETYINVTADQGSAKVKITIKPKYHTIEDPFIKWGTPRGDVVEKLAQTPSWEDEFDITYTYGNVYYGDSHIATNYRFKYGLYLASVIVFINNDYYAEAALHLAERFQYVGEKDNVLVFADALDTKEVSTTVTLSKQSGQYVIIYSQYK